MTKVTWIGHSTVLLEVDGVRIVTDPVLRPRFAHLRRVAGAASALPELDVVLISHLHYDHLDLASLDRLGRSLRVVVPTGGGNLLRKRGFTNVEEVDRGGEVQIGTATVRATHADHDGRRNPFGAEAPAVGYVVQGSVRVYFAGDTDLFDEMSALAPGLDLALLPVGGWGHRVPAGHLDPERAARALVMLRPRMAIPIHWGTYRPIGFRNESSARAAEAFADRARELAPDVDVHIVRPGGTLDLAPAATTAP